MNQEVTPTVAGTPFTADGLRMMTEALGLSMLPTTLRHCAEYYKAARRDPAAEELYLFDKLSKNGLKRADRAALSEMYTKSDADAALFADLMAHRGTGHRDGDTPPTLADLAAVAGSAAKNAEGSVFGNVAMGFTATGDRRLAVRGYRKAVATGNTDNDVTIGIRVTDEARKKPLAGDYVYVLRPAASETGEKKFTEFLLRHLSCGVIKAVKLMQKDADGLLSSLLTLNCGLSLRPQTLLDNEDFKLADLEQCFDGALVVASPAQSADLLLDAVEALQPPVRVATVEKDDRLRITRNGKTVAYPLSFLCGLALTRTFSASLNLAAEDKCDARIARRGICELDGHTFSLVRATASGECAFRSVVLGAIAALTQSVAMGGSLREALLELQIRVGEVMSDDGAFDNVLGALLAVFHLYRAFPLYGSAPTLTVTKEEGLSVNCAALSGLRTKPIGAFATTPGSNIYYLAPGYGGNSLPDLEDLARMFAYVEALIADGTVLSARPVNDNLLSALDEMSRDLTIEYLLDVELPARVGGLLIETARPIQGSLVAKTEWPEEPEEPKNSDETESHS